MTFWEFLDSSPILAFLLAGLFVGFMTGVISLVKTSIRHMTIRKHGWPPGHCDVDGGKKEDDDM